MKYCQVILSFMAKCFAFVHHQSCLTSHPVRLRSSGASYISGGSCYLYFIQFLDHPQMKELRRSGLICVGHLIEPTAITMTNGDVIFHIITGRCADAVCSHVSARGLILPSGLPGIYRQACRRRKKKKHKTLTSWHLLCCG